MRLSLQFDTSGNQIVFSDLQELTFSIPYLLGSVLTVAVLKVARPRDARLERFLATGVMADLTGRITHSFWTWYRDAPRTGDELVDMARTICQVGDDNAWVFSWQLKVFLNAFHPLTTERWSASAACPLLIETVVRLPPEVNDVAVHLFRNIIGQVWQWGAGEGQDLKEIEIEKRKRIGDAMNWGDLEWYDRRGIENGVAQAVMRLDPLCCDAAADNRREPMFLKLLHAEAGSENEVPT